MSKEKKVEEGRNEERNIVAPEEERRATDGRLYKYNISRWTELSANIAYLQALFVKHRRRAFDPIKLPANQTN